MASSTFWGGVWDGGFSAGGVLAASQPALR
jgi:hypothetical protein